MKNEIEKWKDVADPFWEKYYQVSNKGGVRSKDRVIKKAHPRNGVVYDCHYSGKQIKPRTNKIEKHLFCDLRCVDEDGKIRQKSLYVHKAVMEAFSPAPTDIIIRKKLINDKGYYRKSEHTYRYVEHIDGNYNNNCLENLRWITTLDLYRKQVKNGRVEKMELYKLSSVWKKNKNK